MVCLAKEVEIGKRLIINGCDEDKIYEVKILDEDDALRLFSF